MNANIILDSLFPHGSPDGFRQGCRGGRCPATVACRDVHRRYIGDFTFRRLFDAGVTAAEILAQEALQAAVDAAKPVSAPRVRVKKDRRPEANRARPQEYVVDRAVLRKLLDEGLTDREIADRMNENRPDGVKIDRRQVNHARRYAGWERNPARNVPRRGSIDSRLHEVAHLSLEEAAKVLGRKPSYIKRRRQIAARNNQTPAPTGVS